MKLRDLHQSHSEIIKKIKSLNQKQESRNLTESESSELEDLFNKGKELKSQIEKREKIKELELSAERAKAAPRMETRRFSLIKAIKSLAGKQPLDGLEREFDQEARSRGISIPGAGIHVPAEALFGAREKQPEKRIVNAESEFWSDGVRGELTLQALSQASVLDFLNITSVSGDGRFSFPVLGGSTADWKKLDGTDGATESDITLSSRTSRPQSFLVSKSGWTVAQTINASSTDPSIEGLIRNDMMRAAAEKLNEGIIKGSGVAPVPKGLTKQTTVTSDTKDLSASGSWSWPDFTKFIQDWKTGYKNNQAQPRWIISNLVEKELRDKLKFAVNGSETILGDDNMLAGHPVRATGWLDQPSPATADDGEIELLFGDFSNCLLVSYMSVMLEIGQENDDFSKGIQRVKITQCIDFLIGGRAESMRFYTVDRKA